MVVKNKLDVTITFPNKICKVIVIVLLFYGWNSAFVVNAQSYDSLMKVGFDLQVIGKYDEAVKLYDQMLQTWINDPNILYQKALCLMRMSYPDQAVDLFHRITVLRPSFVGGFYGLATAYVALERWLEAYDFIEKTIALEDNNSEYYLLRGRILVGLNRTKEACKDFKRAKKMGSYDAPFLIKTYCK